MRRIIHEVFFCVFITLSSLLLLVTSVFAGTYAKGTVTLSGAAFTGSASVYLNCNGDNWSYCSDWDSIDTSDGSYSLGSNNYSYNCCSSKYKDTSWNSCEIYAYQWNDSTVANSEKYAVTLDCDSSITQDLALKSKDKKLVFSMTSGTDTVSAGVTAYCSQNVSPWTYGNCDVASDGTCTISLLNGTYNCGAYCDWNTYKGNCPYTLAKQQTITIAESDSTVTAIMDMPSKNKTIRTTVKAGSKKITSGVSVSCNMQESPWTYGSSDTATDGGTYDLKVTAGTYRCNSYCATWPCDFTGNPSSEVTVSESDTVVDTELAYTVMDKKIYTKILAGSTKITSGMTVSCYKQGGDWRSSTAKSPNADGLYECEVGSGKYSVSAYCADYKVCDVRGYPRAEVTMEDADESANVILTYLKNDATIAGVVTDGSNGIANVWVSINAYDVTAEDGATAVSSSVRNFATVTETPAEATQVYISAQTDSSGAFSARVPGGATYTLSVWPPYDRKDLASTSVEVSAVKDKTTAATLVMDKKTAVIAGCVTDANGKAVSAYISCSSYNGSAYSGDYLWSDSDSSGCYSFYAVEDRTYNCTANAKTWGVDNNTLCNFSNEGMKAVTAGSTAQTVNFTIPTCDCKMTVNVVDKESNIVSNVSGSCDATPSSFASNDYYYGIWGWISGGTGTIEVQEDKEYSFNCWLYDTDYTVGNEVTGTCSDGTGSVNISLDAVIKDAVSGGFVDSDGNTVDLSSAHYLSVYCNKGRNHRSCDTTKKDYSCDLSEGDWMCGYWIDSSSGYASHSTGTDSSKVTVTSAGGEKKDIVLLKTGTVSATVYDLDGSKRRNVSVQICPYSASQEGANDYQYNYNCGWCYAQDGTCEAKVGATTTGTDYYCNAYIPYTMRNDEYLNNPQEQKVTVIAGQSTTCDLQYAQPDAIATITLTEGSVATSSSQGIAYTIAAEGPRLKQVINPAESASSPIAEATVDCFSAAGGSFEVTTDTNGTTICPCTKDHKWYIVAHNLVGNALYTCKTTEITCSETGTGTCSLDHVATVPESKSQTVTNAASQALTLELSDGASCSFPQGSLSSDAKRVSCTADITVTPFTANRQPASFYAYSVYCFDENNVAINQLNSEATCCLPYNQNQVTNMDLKETDLESTYFDDSKGTYTGIESSVLDSDNDTICFNIDHLTDFAIVGNGNLGSVQGTDDGKVGTEDDPGAAATGSAAAGCTLLR